MQDYSGAIAAGEYWELTAQADYLRVQAADQTLRVESIDAGYSFALRVGQSVRLPTAVTGFRIYNTGAATATVTVLVGMGDFRDNALVGTVTIDSTTPVSVEPEGGALNNANPPWVQFGTAQEVKFPTAQPVSLNGTGTVQFAAAQPVTPQPPTVGSVGGGVVTTTLATWVAPASNTNGYRVDALGFALATGGCSVRVMMAQTAPSSINDTAAGTLGLASYSVSGYPSIVNRADLPLIIPAGWGMYATANANSVNVDFMGAYL